MLAVVTAVLVVALPQHWLVVLLFAALLMFPFWEAMRARLRHEVWVENKRLRNMGFEVHVLETKCDNKLEEGENPPIRLRGDGVIHLAEPVTAITAWRPALRADVVPEAFGLHRRRRRRVRPGRCRPQHPQHPFFIDFVQKEEIQLPPELEDSSGVFALFQNARWRPRLIPGRPWLPVLDGSTVILRGSREALDALSTSEWEIETVRSARY